MSFVLDGYFRESNLNFNFSIAWIKSSYGNIFSFPNKLKFDDSNICTKRLIREQKIIHNCPSNTLIYLKSYVWMFKYFELLKYGWKLQITRDSIYYMENLFIYKKMKVPFSSTMQRYFITAPDLNSVSSYWPSTLS